MITIDQYSNEFMFRVKNRGYAFPHRHIWPALFQFEMQVLQLQLLPSEEAKERKKEKKVPHLH